MAESVNGAPNVSENNEGFVADTVPKLNSKVDLVKAHPLDGQSQLKKATSSTEDALGSDRVLDNETKETNSTKIESKTESQLAGPQQDAKHKSEPRLPNTPEVASSSTNSATRIVAVQQNSIKSRSEHIVDVTTAKLPPSQNQKIVAPSIKPGTSTSVDVVTMHVSVPAAPKSKDSNAFHQGAVAQESPRLSLNPQFDLSDRDSKSERFNSLKPGDQVIICHNHRTGHHDVTGKRAYLNNKKATVLEVAMWPNTWLSVRVLESGEKVKVRTSNIMLLKDYESDSYQALLKKHADKAVSGAQPPLALARKPRKEPNTVNKNNNPTSSTKAAGPRRAAVMAKSKLYEGQIKPKQESQKRRITDPVEQLVSLKRKKIVRDFSQAREYARPELVDLQKNFATYNPCLFCGVHVNSKDRQFCSIVCNAQHTLVVRGGVPVTKNIAQKLGANLGSQSRPKIQLNARYPILIPSASHGSLDESIQEDSTCPFEGCGYVCDSEQYMTDHIAYFHKNQTLGKDPHTLKGPVIDRNHQVYTNPLAMIGAAMWARDTRDDKMEQQGY